MKKFYQIILWMPFIFIAMVETPALGQKDALGLKPPILQPRGEDSLFLKLGGGFNYEHLFFQHYDNLTLLNGISNEYDFNQIDSPESVGFLEVGVDFPDQFTLFASGGWLDQDLVFMVNAQRNLFNDELLKPYIFLGLGLDNQDNFASSVIWAPAAQLGVGTDIQLNPKFILFLETRLCLSGYISTSNLYPSYNYTFFQVMVPVETGLKFNI